MLVTPEIDYHNRRHAVTLAALVAIAGGFLAWLYLPLLATLALAPLAYWWIRRRCLRRIAVARQPFPPAWQMVLDERVRFYQVLDDEAKQRFRQMVSVFLDEIRITGVRTEVDDTVRVLVAASAIIPIFGFADWDYHRLGEVLVYPTSFDSEYHSDKPADANILGLTGFGHLRGVMILSKPSLMAAFSDCPSKENVGVHEFAHLVEQEEAESGLPPGVPREVIRQWIEYTARELAHPSNRKTGISDYAYTNEHEFFAVLSEYFFSAPEVLKSKDPALYEMLSGMFHQDPAALTSHLPRLRRRIRRNGPCPCGSGKKFKNCCLHKAVESIKGCPA